MWARVHKEIEKRTMLDHDGVEESTSTERPVCGSESTKRCVLTPIHAEEDQTSTGRPVLVDQKEEHEIEFQSTRTVTCSCERSLTSPCSRVCEKDRTSYSSRNTSCRLAAEQRLQPIQQKIE